MARNKRHISKGIEAVVDSAFVVVTDMSIDIHVDADEIAEAVAQHEKLRENHWHPEIYQGQAEGRATLHYSV